jgi:NitT/TauT family transport system substrate-binding protein
VIQQVIAGNVPFGFAAATSILIGAENDPSLRVMFCNTARNVFGISVPAGSDITDPSGFEGKVLGISEQGGGETPMVEAALLEAGLTPGEDVELLPIGGSGPAAQRAIEAGRVDGYASAYTDIIALQAAGLELEDITPEKYAGVPGDCLVAKEESLEDAEVRDQIVRLARAWSKGNLFATSNPDRALEIGCTRFPEDCTDEEFAKQYMDTRVQLLTPVGAELGQTDTPYGLPPVGGWQTAVDLLVSSDQLSEPIDVGGLLETPEVEEIVAEWSDYDREEVKQLAEQAG